MVHHTAISLIPIAANIYGSYAKSFSYSHESYRNSNSYGGNDDSILNLRLAIPSDLSSYGQSDNRGSSQSYVRHINL